MSDVEEVFPILLSNVAGVGAIAGGNLFPNRVPQRENLAAVIWRRISGGPLRTLAGKAGVRKAAFQIESWSQVSQEEARRLNGFVREIDGTRGLVGAWWLQALLINPDSDADNPQIPIHADDLGLFCSFTEFVVFYKPGV